MNLSMIVAASENDVIGNAGNLPWKLSADLKRFKSLTMGHHIIMGRKTYESIGRCLPGRTTVILTQQQDYSVPGAKVVTSVGAALEACQGDDRPFVTGGADVYALFLPEVSEILLTRVHVKVDGDTLLPEIDWVRWRLVKSDRHEADEENDFAYSFEVYRRS